MTADQANIYQWKAATVFWAAEEAHLNRFFTGQKTAERFKSVQRHLCPSEGTLKIQTAQIWGRTRCQKGGIGPAGTCFAIPARIIACTTDNYYCALMLCQLISTLDHSLNILLYSRMAEPCSVQQISFIWNKLCTDTENILSPDPQCKLVVQRIAGKGWKGSIWLSVSRQMWSLFFSLILWLFWSV